MAAPLHGDQATLGMIYIESASADLQYGEAELMALAGIARAASTRIDALMHGAAVQRAATITTEHAIARQTQDAVTISAIPTIDGLQAAAYRHLGESSCTDYYDIVAMRDKRCAIVVAKIEADLLNTPRFFAELRAAFRYAALYQEAPHTFCRALNWLLFNQHRNNIHMMVAQIDPATGKVDYCITGRRVHTGRIGDDGDGELVRLAGFPPVGIERAPAYELNQIVLESGQSLLICTDGAKTAVNREGQPLGIGGIEEEVCDGLGDTPGHVLRDFAADLHDYIDGGRHPEDVTAVLVRKE
jgi:serine phosphatase RsbU (regulator of sigma subunit)